MQIGNFGFESVKMKLVGIGIALCLSLISYYLIERPFRNRNLIGGRPFLSSLSVGLLATVFALTLTIQNEGFPQRMGELQKLFYDSKRKVASDDNGTCHGRIFGKSCILFSNQSKNIILIGDSHAAALSWALMKTASRNNWKLTMISTDACNQLPGLARDASLDTTSYLRKVTRRCLVSTNRLDKFLQSSVDATIVYFARLPVYLEGSSFDNGEGGFEPDCKAMCGSHIDRNLFPEAGSRDMVISLGLNRWQKIGHNLILVYPYPEMGWDVPKKIRRELSGFPLLTWATKYKDIVVSTSYQLFKKRTASSYRALDRLPDNGRTYRIKPEEWICSVDTDRCSANDADGIYYADDDHPSTVGSIKIVDQIEEIVRDQIIQEP
jgi:hypothetical protein